MELTRREQQILDETKERLARWGRHADIPATPHEMAQLAIKLHDELTTLGKQLAQAVTEVAQVVSLREELTLANRQLAAAKAREAGLRKKQQQQESE